MTAVRPNFRQPRIRCRRHLAFVGACPCCVCQAAEVHVHHLTFAQPRARGLKSGDDFTVPLCLAHHTDLHARGDERSWWRDRHIDPLPIAAALWAQSVMAGRVGRMAA